MAKNYTLNTWYETPVSKLYFGRWICRIEFMGRGLGNTNEAERIAYNALRSAKRSIRNNVKKHEHNPQTRNAYEVIENSFTLGGGQLKTLTIAKK